MVALCFLRQTRGTETGLGDNLFEVLRVCLTEASLAGFARGEYRDVPAMAARLVDVGCEMAHNSEPALGDGDLRG